METTTQVWGPRSPSVIALAAWGVLVSARDVFSVQELAQLRGFPGISAEDLIRFFHVERRG